MRRFRNSRSMLVCIILIWTLTVSAQEIGPSNGSLVVVGGAMKDTGILERFFELAGGVNVPVVVIPTAGQEHNYDEDWPGLNQFKAVGATNLTVLHTRDRSVSNSKDFIELIRSARGVWFSGGRQWRLADAYLDTSVHEELRKLLRRGGVIGGSSAGASIQGTYLVRGDTKTNTIMMGDHEKGFEFLKNVAIDQHLLKRNRQFDLTEIIEAYPDLLGIGIDEDTAIVVQRDKFEVIGKSYVAIYDRQNRVDTGKAFYLLSPGDIFDLKARQPYRPTTVLEPLEAAEKKAWSKKK